MDKRDKDFKETIFTTRMYKFFLVLENNPTKSIQGLERSGIGSYSSVFNNLRYLERLDLFSSIKEGRERYYFLTEKGEKLSKLIKKVIIFCEDLEKNGKI